MTEFAHGVVIVVETGFDNMATDPGFKEIGQSFVGARGEADTRFEFVVARDCCKEFVGVCVVRDQTDHSVISVSEDSGQLLLGYHGDDRVSDSLESLPTLRFGDVGPFCASSSLIDHIGILPQPKEKGVIADHRQWRE
jgi:hypothetical protein